MKEINGSSITAMILGIISCVSVLFGFYGAAAGLPCGILALIFSCRKHQFQLNGLALSGLVTGIVGIFFSTILIVCFFWLLVWKAGWYQFLI